MRFHKMVPALFAGFFFVGVTVLSAVQSVYIYENDGPFLMLVSLTGSLRLNTEARVDVYLYLWDEPVDPDNITGNVANFHGSHLNVLVPLSFQRVSKGHYTSTFFMSSNLSTQGGYLFRINYLKVNATKMEYSAEEIYPFLSETDRYSVDVVPPPHTISRHFYPGDEVPFKVKFYRNGELYDPNMDSVSVKVYFKDYIHAEFPMPPFNFSLERISQGVYESSYVIPTNSSRYGEFEIYVIYSSPTGAVRDTFRFIASPYSVWLEVLNNTEDALDFVLYLSERDGPASTVKVNVTCENETGMVFIEKYTNASGVLRVHVDGPFCPYYKKGIITKIVSSHFNTTLMAILPPPERYPPGSGPVPYLRPVEWNVTYLGSNEFPLAAIPPGEEPQVSYQLLYRGSPVPNTTLPFYIHTSGVVLYSTKVTTDSSGIFRLPWAPSEEGIYSILLNVPLGDEGGNVMWRFATTELIVSGEVRGYTYMDVIDPHVRITASELYPDRPIYITWEYDTPLVGDTEPIFYMTLGEFNLSTEALSSPGTNWLCLQPKEFHLSYSEDYSTYTARVVLPGNLPRDRPLQVICGYRMLDGNLNPLINLPSYMRVNVKRIDWVPPHGNVTGVVVDGNGHPIEGVKVWVCGNYTTTDEEGRYTITLPPGVYEMKFSREGYSLWMGKVRIVDEGTTTLNVILLKLKDNEGNLVVNVTNPAGLPVPGATLRVMDLNLSCNATPEGRVLLSPLPGGVHTIVVMAEGYMINVTRIAVEANQTTYTSLVLFPLPPYPAGNVIGTVVDAATGSPLEGAMLYLRTEDYSFFCTTDRNGFFSYILLPPGNYEVTVCMVGYENYTGAFTISLNTTLERRIALFPLPQVYGGSAERMGKGKWSFVVYYRDPMGRAPREIVVVIDGEEHRMDLSGGSPMTGAKYTFVTSLEEGEHTYYFVVQGPSGERILPEDETPWGEETQGTLRVEERSRTGGLPLILGVVALVAVIAVVAALLLRRKRSVADFLEE